MNKQNMFMANRSFRTRNLSAWSSYGKNGDRFAFLSAGQQHDEADVEDVGMPYLGASAASL